MTDTLECKICRNAKGIERIACFGSLSFESCFSKFLSISIEYGSNLIISDSDLRSDINFLSHYFFLNHILMKNLVSIQELPHNCL